MPSEESRDKMVKEMEALKAELQERKLSLPAHSLRPHQWMLIEELEDKIRLLEEKLKNLGPPSVPEEKK